MSVKIGIVCEGISDFRVLKHITERYLRDEDVYTIPLKPKVTPLGKQDGFGGWQGVLEYIEGNDRMIVEAIEEGCSYVIIHIDTDVRESYGIDNKYENDKDLHNDVVSMLTEKVNKDFDKDKLIFAVAINETECWLIPFLTSNAKECSRTDSCVASINRQLKGAGFIDKDNKNADKAKSTYDKILKLKRKAKDFKEISNYNYGFSYFISSLDKIKEEIMLES